MFLKIDGNDLFALDFGKGPRTLLAHSGWVGNFEDWICTLAPLSRDWRVVVYDHRGCGESRVDPAKISHQALIDDVFRVMDTLAIERCVLGGFSRGAVTALRAVLQRPERFDGMILLNGDAMVTRPNEERPARPAPSNWPGATHVDRLRWFAERCTPETAETAATAGPSTGSGPASTPGLQPAAGPDVQTIRRWAVNILARATPEAAERLMTMPLPSVIDWSQALPGIRIPSLLIHGELDPFCSADHMRYIADQIPHSKLVVLPGTGHLPAMSQPDRVASEIANFFASRPA